MIFSCKHGWVESTELPLSHTAIQFGKGVFETLRSYPNQQIGFVPEHITRLQAGIKELGLTQHITEQALQARLQEALVKGSLDPETECIRLKIIALEDDLFIQVTPLQMDPVLMQGVNLAVVPWSRSLPHLKSISYLDALHAQQKAIEQECYDALMTDQQGFITETSKANLFWSKGSKIFTTQENALHGIIQDFFVSQVSLEIQIQKVTLEELLQADEVMLTNSIIGIIPVNQIHTGGQAHALPSAKPIWHKLNSLLLLQTHDYKKIR